MTRTTLDRVVALVPAAVAVALVLDQRGVPIVPIVYRATWWTAARVAAGAGRVAIAAELAYRESVTSGGPW